MNVTLFARLAVLFLGVLALWASLRFILVPTVVEEAREELFHQRRRLFLIMARGGVDCEHPAYRDLTRRFNALIARVEHLSLWRVIWFKLFDRFYSSRLLLPDLDWTGVPGATKAAMCGTMHSASDVLMRRALLGTPSAWPLVPLVLVYRAASHVGAMSRRAKQRIPTALAMEAEYRSERVYERLERLAA